MNSNRFMRLFVMFDMPTETKAERKEYTKFRKRLLNNGFDMLQYSVYTRFCHNDTEVKKHIKRLTKNSPNVGNVRILKVTEGQYENMVFLNGEQTSQEKVVGSNNIVVVE